LIDSFFPFPAIPSLSRLDSVLAFPVRGPFKSLTIPSAEIRRQVSSCSTRFRPLPPPKAARPFHTLLLFPLFTRLAPAWPFYFPSVFVVERYCQGMFFFPSYSSVFKVSALNPLFPSLPRLVMASSFTPKYAPSSPTSLAGDAPGLKDTLVILIKRGWRWLAFASHIRLPNDFFERINPPAIQQAISSFPLLSPSENRSRPTCLQNLLLDKQRASCLDALGN